MLYTNCMDSNDAQTLEEKAGRLRNQGKGYEAVKIYQQAKAAYAAKGDLAQIAGCQHMIGVSYKIENDLERALPAYEQAIKDYEIAGDPLGPGRVQRDVGIMYEYHDQLDKAESYLLQSKEGLEGLPEDLVVNDMQSRNGELGITLAKLGLLSIRLKKLQAAERYLMDGLFLIRKAGHTFYELTALMHLGSLYFATKHYGRMIANLEAALGLLYEHNLQHEQTRRLAQIWGQLAHGYLHHANHTTARYYAEKAFAVIAGLSASAQGPIKKDIDFDTLKRELSL